MGDKIFMTVICSMMIAISVICIRSVIKVLQELSESRKEISKLRFDIKGITYRLDKIDRNKADTVILLNETKEDIKLELKAVPKQVMSEFKNELYRLAPIKVITTEEKFNGEL